MTIDELHGWLKQADLKLPLHVTIDMRIWDHVPPDEHGLHPVSFRIENSRVGDGSSHKYSAADLWLLTSEDLKTIVTAMAKYVEELG